MQTNQVIEKLPSTVVDQIAAGEVVERPAHLVKELIENSLDALADEIDVEIEGGGRRVLVTDNGSGIHRDQMSLALDRHATSKIRAASDLWQVRSYGFRGEALAAIAAVSKLKLTSRIAGDENAWQICNEFSERSGVERVGGAKGTSILIEELFANVPARLKFLKSESAEANQIKMVVKALALAYPKVSFRLKVNGKLCGFWPKTDSALKRTSQILENEKLFEATQDSANSHCRIVFASPNDTFGTSRNIWLFAQNRWIQDRTLQAAVLEAYRGLLMHGEFPYCVVWLNCDPQLIDVNIHPSKAQVKFQDPQQIFRLIHQCLRQSLEKAPWVKVSLQSSSSSQAKTDPISQSLAVNAQFKADEFNAVQFKQKQYEMTTPASSQVGSTVEGYTRRENSKAEQWGRLQVLGQAALTYIVTQTAEQLIFVDQHAAHERIAYEKLMRLWNGEKTEVQNFLLPLSMDIDEGVFETVLNCKNDLSKLGIEIDRGGPSTLLISSAPAILKDTAVVQAIHKMSREMLEGNGSYAVEKSIAEICATMACHSVVRAGQALSYEEMRALLSAMDEFPLSSFCPHGRPVFVEYPFQRLERDFGRIV